MLVLSRRLDESLIINGNIEVIVTGVSGTKVSLGIVAPSDVSVFRKELCGTVPEKKVPRCTVKSGAEATPKKNCWNVLKRVQSLTNSVR